jgi:ketosteroid isomerase-like protein
MNTREVVDKYYSCVNTADWAGYLMLFSDDCVCDEQLAGHLVGIEALRPLIDGFPTSFSRFQMFPQRVVIDGEAAAVVWRVEAVVAAGVPIAYPTNPDGSSRQVIGANYFQVQNGKIVYMRTIHDSLPFAPLTDPVTVSS